MRSAVETAFRSCPAEDFVLLKLTYLAELRAAEVAKMFGCSRSTIDRQVEVADRGIEWVALQSIKARDPWLELQWSDFVELGRTATPACCGMEEVSEQVAQASGLGHFKLASRRLALPYFTLAASTGAGFVSAGCARKPSRIRSEVAMPLTSGRWLRAKAKTYFGFFSKL